MKFDKDKLKNFFEKSRILLSKKEKLEIEKTPQQRADLIAKSILDLLEKTMTNGDMSTGKVEFTDEQKKYLGKPGNGTSLTPGTNFNLNNDNFEITLDYSTECFAFIELKGNNKSFINTDDYKTYYDVDGNEIDIDYLIDTLEEFGIEFSYRQKLESTTKSTLVEHQIVTISLPIEKMRSFKTR